MWQFQMMIQWLPAGLVYWVTVVLFFGGILAYLISKFIKFIPFVNQYKFPIEILSVVAMLIGGYFYGGAEYRLKAQEMVDKIAVAEKQSQDANDRLQDTLKKKQQVIREKEYVIREKIVQVKEKIDAECKVAPDAVQLINEAAKEPVKK